MYSSYCSEPHPRNSYLLADVASPNAATQSTFVAFTPPPGKPGIPPSVGNSRMSRYHDKSPSAMSRVPGKNKWTMQKSVTDERDMSLDTPNSEHRRQQNSPTDPTIRSKFIRNWNLVQWIVYLNLRGIVERPLYFNSVGNAPVVTQTWRKAGVAISHVNVVEAKTKIQKSIECTNCVIWKRQEGRKDCKHTCGYHHRPPK
jgi:hypothetical protein